MTHTCRESCGVCGFLSSSNKEKILVVLEIIEWLLSLF